jgi:hypothetical protein
MVNCLIHISNARRVPPTLPARDNAESLMAGLKGDRLPNCANPDIYKVR